MSGQSQLYFARRGLDGLISFSLIYYSFERVGTAEVFHVEQRTAALISHRLLKAQKLHERQTRAKCNSARRAPMGSQADPSATTQEDPSGDAGAEFDFERLYSQAVFTAALADYCIYDPAQASAAGSQGQQLYDPAIVDVSARARNSGNGRAARRLPIAKATSVDESPLQLSKEQSHYSLPLAASRDEDGDNSGVGSDGVQPGAVTTARRVPQGSDHVTAGLTSILLPVPKV